MPTHTDLAAVSVSTELQGRAEVTQPATSRHRATAGCWVYQFMHTKKLQANSVVTFGFNTSALPPHCIATVFHILVLLLCLPEQSFRTYEKL